MSLPLPYPTYARVGFLSTYEKACYAWNHCNCDVKKFIRLYAEQAQFCLTDVVSFEIWHQLTQTIEEAEQSNMEFLRTSHIPGYHTRFKKYLATEDEINSLKTVRDMLTPLVF